MYELFLKDHQPWRQNLPPIEHTDVCYQVHLLNQQGLAYKGVHSRFYPEPDLEAIKRADRPCYSADYPFGLLRFGKFAKPGKPVANQEEVICIALNNTLRAFGGIIGPVASYSDLYVMPDRFLLEAENISLLAEVRALRSQLNKIKEAANA